MTTTFRHNSTLHFRYEKVTKPFLGPRTKAFQALSSFSGNPVSEEEFLNHLQINYPHYYQAIEWVRFHKFDFSDKNSGFVYRIAIINTIANPVIRDKFFEDRVEITISTGWYPLIQGSRAQIYDRPYRDTEKWRANKLIFKPKSFGRLIKLRPLSNSDEDGNSFLIEGSKSNIMLDTGMSLYNEYIDNISFIFLSHYHRDHSGSVWNYTTHTDTPIILSQVTLNRLCMFNHISFPNKRKLALNSVYPENVKVFQMADGGMLRFYPIYHCPGAYGISVSDNNTSISYFGDLCLKNGFKDFSKEAANFVPQNVSNNWLLLDAAMVGRKEQVTEEQKTPEQIIKELVSSASKRNVIFISNQPENLIYAYLRTFKLTNGAKRPVRIFVSNELYQTIQVLWKPVILHEIEFSDPIVKNTIGKSMINFAETHRLYPLIEKTLSEMPSDEPCIIFSAPEEIYTVPSLGERVKNSNIIISGTMALRDEIPSVLDKNQPILRVASPDWSFHSDEESLAEFIRELTVTGVKVVLFHNYSKRISKFIKSFDLDKSLVFPLKGDIDFHV